MRPTRQRVKSINEVPHRERLRFYDPLQMPPFYVRQFVHAEAVRVSHRPDTEKDRLKMRPDIKKSVAGAANGGYTLCVKHVVLHTFF